MKREAVLKQSGVHTKNTPESREMLPKNPFRLQGMRWKLINGNVLGCADNFFTSGVMAFFFDGRFKHNFMIPRSKEQSRPSCASSGNVEFVFDTSESRATRSETNWMYCNLA